MTVVHDREVFAEGDALLVETTSRLASGSGQLVGALIGAISVIIGVLAVSLSGIDSTLNTPVVSVIGLHQSAVVGIAEVILGLLLIAGATSVWDRALMGLVGGVMFVIGILLAVSTARMLAEVGADHATGWTLLVGGALAMMSAVLPGLTRSAHRAS